MAKPNEQIPDDLTRYAKQIRVPNVGVDGQRRIQDSRIVVIGCGALGSVSANLLARSGVGELLIIDRDFVELDNLQRQVLYHENDVGLPKAVVAAERLQQINSSIKIEHQVCDVDFRNIEELLTKPRAADAVVDGTDNFEVRFLINDACVNHNIPWVYAGALGAEGQVMSILPGETPCLSCLMTDGPPPPGTTGTCDTAGILSTIINVVAAFQVNEVLKILIGDTVSINRKLMVFDMWGNRTQAMDVSGLKDKIECQTCDRMDLPWLKGQQGSQSVVLCGRNAVQVSFPDRKQLSLEDLATRLGSLGTVSVNPYLVRFEKEDFVITAFRDGRAIINGTEDIAVAKKLYAQYIGS